MSGSTAEQNKKHTLVAVLGFNSHENLKYDGQVGSEEKYNQESLVCIWSGRFEHGEHFLLAAV